MTTSGGFYRRILLPISKASYGMYLSHMILLIIVSGWLRSTLGIGNEGSLGIWTTPLQIVSTAIATFLGTAIFCTLIQRVPKIGKWIVG